MRSSCAFSSIDEIPRREVIALAAASAVDDRRDTSHRCIDADTCEEITGGETYGSFVLTRPAAEDSNIVSRIAQPTDDVMAECAGAACNQDGIHLDLP